MKLTDILPLDQWVAFEKDIHERSGLDVNVFDTNGIRITDYKQWINRFCPAVKADDRGQSYICAVAHMNIAEMARQARAAVIEECDAGLLKLVVPIFIKDEFVGAVGACGLLLENGEIDTFMVNKTLGMAEDDIEALSNDILHVPQSDVETLAGYIRERLDRILGETACKTKNS
jgi:ligand-binding sensor protein